MPSVRCPVCLISYELAPEEAGGKIQCRVCGQKMRVAAPPAGENKTVMVRWEEPEAVPAPPPVRRQDRRPPDDPPPVRASRHADDDEDEDPDDRPRRRRRRRHEEDYDDRPGRYCRHCDRRVRPDVSSRMAQPWSLVCFIVGAVLVFFLLGIALIIIGALLKQRVEYCPDCGDELHVGDVGF
jgi:hypothetical protein